MKPEDFFLRAATFDEILSDDFECDALSLPSEATAQRLMAWKKACTNGEEDLFNRRIAREDWPIDFIHTRFSSARAVAGITYPAWVHDAAWIVDALKCEQPVPSLAIGPAQPFQDLFLNLIWEARRQRDANLVPGALHCFTPQALQTLDLQLSIQLTDLCAALLYEMFERYRSEAVAATKKGTQLYDDFIAALKQRLLENLFEAKPVLLRLVAVVTRQWMAVTHEFLLRLYSDRAAIGGYFFNAAPLPVTDITFGLSDLHNHGRSVYIVTFSNSSRVVYKPKDLRLEKTLEEMIAQFNRMPAPVDLRPMRVLCREGYGWAEYLSHQSCANDDGINLFFHRTGAWLALFHLLCTTDMHEENMIAVGDQPVPIDLEMLFQLGKNKKPVVAALAAFEAAQEKLLHSVRMIGLLPGYFRAADGAVINKGGLQQRAILETVVALCAVNTDQMQPVECVFEADQTYNMPLQNGVPVRAHDYAVAMMEGFKAYTDFLTHAAADLLLDHIEKNFKDLPARVIVRPTQFYGTLFSRIKDHHRMDDGILWSVQADFISRFSHWNSEDDQSQLMASERRALYALNVPYFTSPIGSDIICGEDNFRSTSNQIDAATNARQRILNCDAEEQNWQLEVIRLSFLGGHGAVPSKAPANAKRETATSAATGDKYRRYSGVIADKIMQQAIVAGESAAWLMLEWTGEKRDCQLIRAGFDIYAGVTGIALFLAAYAKVTGDARAAALARKALTPLRYNLHDLGAGRFVRSMGVGGAAGLGSIVYALTVIADLLDDENVLEEAKYAASFFTPDFILADTKFDIIDGSAGAILCLLKLYGRTRRNDYLDKAILCGEHLLKNRTAATHGGALWPGTENKVLTGFSHGAAGYAYALSALAAATHNKRFADAADVCVAYEAKQFSDKDGNWPDLREFVTRSDRTYSSCQWCHGAGGIGMARLAMIKAVPHYVTTLRGDIEKALTCTHKNGPRQSDTLCCGNMGNIEFYREYARTLNQPAMNRVAQEKIDQIILDYEQTGLFQLNEPESDYSPGLFQGLAGLGYGALRVIDPLLPNLLIWE